MTSYHWISKFRSILSHKLPIGTACFITFQRLLTLVITLFLPFLCSKVSAVQSFHPCLKTSPCFSVTNLVVKRTLFTFLIFYIEVLSAVRNVHHWHIQSNLNPLQPPFSAGIVFCYKGCLRLLYYIHLSWLSISACEFYFFLFSIKTKYYH